MSSPTSRSYTTASARAMACAPAIVSSPRPPGPAPTSVTFPVIAFPPPVVSAAKRACARARQPRAAARSPRRARTVRFVCGHIQPAQMQRIVLHLGIGRDRRKAPAAERATNARSASAQSRASASSSRATASSSSPARPCTARIACPAAGMISSGEKYRLMRCSSPSRCSPAAASTSAPYSPRSSLSSRVCTLPRTG